MCGSVCLEVWHTSGDWSHVTPCSKLLIVKVQLQCYATHCVCVCYPAFSTPLSVLPIFSPLPPLMFQTTSIISSSGSLTPCRQLFLSSQSQSIFQSPYFCTSLTNKHLLVLCTALHPLSWSFVCHFSLTICWSVFPGTYYFSLALSCSLSYLITKSNNFGLWHTVYALYKIVTVAVNFFELAYWLQYSTPSMDEI